MGGLYDKSILAIVSLAVILFCLSIFSGAVKVFVVSPIKCMIKGHKYKVFESLDDGSDLAQCDRCGKCIG